MKNSDDNGSKNKNGRAANPADTPARPAAADRTVFRNANQTRIDPRNKQPQQPAPADVTRARPAPPQGGNDATRVRQQPAATGKPAPGAAAANVFASNNGEKLHILKGRFLLEKVLGVGGMGVVYKAKDRNKIEAHDRDPYVAIKVLSDEFKAHPESFIALQRESRKGQRIAHPNVVKVYDFDRDGDVVFMTMEYLEGRPLDQIIKQYSSTGLPRDDIWTILKDICSALAQAHGEKIVHSDLKPGNIFITNNGIAKIFDFGIARAVANIDRHSGKTQDKTVFDAGTLGALTPAYASLEMLGGKEPDVRDDIYALGCIVYEMLTGEHPYNRIPADEAFKRKLKLKRITGIKNRQWKAIEKALAFKREDRIATVAEFEQLMLHVQPRSYLLGGLGVVILVLAAAAGYLFITGNQSQPAQQTVKLDEIEFKIKYDIHKQKIEKLMAEPVFTPGWENDIWDEVKALTDLLAGRPDDWLQSITQKLADMYLARIKALADNREYAKALALIDNAYRYVSDHRILDAEKNRLADLIKQDKDQKNRQVEIKTRDDQTKQTKADEQKRITTQFDLAYRNVKDQLECRARLSMRDFGIAVEKLRSLDLPRYAKLENSIIVTLAGCITEIGKSNPESALESKNYALRIFGDNSLISRIEIKPRDACDVSIAGMGGRGERAVCRDKLSGVGNGPTMVVIPAGGGLAAFAIGKYEISVRELKQYCDASKECSNVGGDDANLPVTNVGIATIKGYLKWLSRTSSQRYRLPSKAEWVYAANANSKSHDPNRNCQLNTRCIEKGGQLVRINTGVQNGWGLVNYLGNAQELVYDKDLSLLAMGGSYEDAMEKCDVRSAKPHNGNADASTGFRVVRELVK